MIVADGITQLQTSMISDVVSTQEKHLSVATVDEVEKRREHIHPYKCQIRLQIRLHVDEVLCVYTYMFDCMAPFFFACHLHCAHCVCVCIFVFLVCVCLCHLWWQLQAFFNLCRVCGCMHLLFLCVFAYVYHVCIMYDKFGDWISHFDPILPPEPPRKKLDIDLMYRQCMDFKDCGIPLMQFMQVLFACFVFLFIFWGFFLMFLDVKMRMAVIV